MLSFTAFFQSMKKIAILLLLLSPFVTLANIWNDYYKSLSLNNYIVEHYIETDKLEYITIVNIFESLLEKKKIPFIEMSYWFFLEEAIKEDFFQFSQKIKNCSDYQSETRDLLLWLPLFREIKGMANGSCSYTQKVGESFQLNCNYPLSVLGTLSQENLNLYNSIDEYWIENYELSIWLDDVEFSIGDDDRSGTDMSQYCEVKM